MIKLETMGGTVQLLLTRSLVRDERYIYWISITQIFILSGLSPALLEVQSLRYHVKLRICKRTFTQKGAQRLNIKLAHRESSGPWEVTGRVNGRAGIRYHSWTPFVLMPSLFGTPPRWVPRLRNWVHSVCWCQSHSDLCAFRVGARTEIGGSWSRLASSSRKWRGGSEGLSQLDLPTLFPTAYPWPSLVPCTCFYVQMSRDLRILTYPNHMPQTFPLWKN